MTVSSTADTSISAPSNAAANGHAAQPRLSPENAARINEMGKRISGAFGEIVGVLMRAPQYRHTFLSDLEWLVLPPLVTGQFALAEARQKESGLTMPIAVLLWASVSDDVDARLSSNLGGQLRLKPNEWTSGANAWLIEAVGDPRAVKALVDQTLAGPLKGRGLKVVTRGADGKPALQVVRAGEATPGNGAAEPKPETVAS